MPLDGKRPFPIMDLFTPRLLAAVLALALVSGAAAPAPADEMRPAVWAGGFYPADPLELKALLDHLMARDAGPKASIPPESHLRALVMPHAGFVYSGPVAAQGARLLRGRHYGKVLLIGPDHRVGLNDAAVSTADAWQTPLGTVPVHTDARRLCRSPLFAAMPADADRREHCLEVVLPFLQYALPEFALVPVIMGPCDVDALAGVLESILDAGTLLVVSSDLSHYLPDREAHRHDRETLESLVDLDATALVARDNSACGRFPLAVLVTIARRRNWHPMIVNYATSADTAGDPARVVGYAAVAFYGDDVMNEPIRPNRSPDVLSEEQGRLLIQLARQTIARHLDQPLADEDAGPRAAADPALKRPSGTFVTLKINGQLRGCIGSLEPREAIFKSVRSNAINAAFRDWRFSPLKAEELEKVQVEVSILTPPAPLEYRNADELKVLLRPGIDGLIIRKGNQGATFLPQVWEQLPRVEDFLSHLCRKAGMAADAWRRGDLTVQTYQVKAFEESKAH